MMPSPLPLPFARRSRNQDICVDALIAVLKGRGWRLRASIARDLGRLAAIRGNPPHLLLSVARGIEIDPPAVPRPARVPIIRRMRGHAQWPRSVHA